MVGVAVVDVVRVVGVAVQAVEGAGVGRRPRVAVAEAGLVVGPVVAVGEERPEALRQQVTAAGDLAGLVTVRGAHGAMVGLAAARVDRGFPGRPAASRGDGAGRYRDPVPVPPDAPFLAACRNRPASRVPVWFMRQAGRSLPEYRALRGVGTILDAVKDPALATEITLQPVRRYGVDAAILYSDIVVPVAALGF